MSRAPVLYLICYDICDDKRLRQVYKTMRGYGERVQYSVFRCALSELRLAQLKGELVDIIAHDEDQVMFVRLGPAGPRRDKQFFTLGTPLPPPERSVRIL